MKKKKKPDESLDYWKGYSDGCRDMLDIIGLMGGHNGRRSKYKQYKLQVA